MAEIEKSQSWLLWQSRRRWSASSLGRPTTLRVLAMRSIYAAIKLSSSWLTLATLLLAILVDPIEAANIDFSNCLDPNMNTSNPVQLQWIPLAVLAVFNLTDPGHNLNVTVYGNVTGTADGRPLPPPGSPAWTDKNDTRGKIIDFDTGDSRYATLFADYNVLSYKPWHEPGTDFCNSTLSGVQNQCPIGPVFSRNDTAIPLRDLPGFTVAHNLYSTYGFTSINAKLSVKSSNAQATYLACISAEITPYLGSATENMLTYLPVLVLASVALATASAAILSPWGTWDVFRCTTNYGRDADLLRLITPGFGDCLQYIQFIVLSGSLSLNYPGYFQPVVSQVSWSTLMFNKSFFSNGQGYQPVMDGIYVTNESYGLGITGQLVGLTSNDDIWAGMMVWLFAIIAAVTGLTQLAFIIRGAYRLLSNTREEDLRAKNWPFSVGNVIRIVFNYFLLPVVALSMFQLVVASQFTVATTALATVTILVLLLFSGWLLYVILVTRPRLYLFDDLPTVLLYGPLYNTYSDNAATFALVPFLLTFVRGVAIGAVQASGVAQIVLLAICEIILILTLNAFRPFHSPTSMNAYHTIFAGIRIVIVLLMVPYVPSLSISDSARGWIGYIILLLHGLVLFVGFFIHSLQTLIEVLALLAGAGGEGGTATRGGLVKVLGVRQLSRRNPRRFGRARSSVASDAVLLNYDPEQETQMSRPDGVRSRSLSASSTFLLNNRVVGSDGRRSFVMDATNNAGADPQSSAGVHAPATPHGATSVFSHLPNTSQAGSQPPSRPEGVVNVHNTEATNPYFRQPKPRRATNELHSSGGRSRNSWTSNDWAKQTSPQTANDELPLDPAEGPSNSGTTPSPAFLSYNRDYAESSPDDARGPKPDYAIREVDSYYRVRGPALSNTPTRRLKTGPADPTGPVSSATGWFKNMFGGKSKDKSKDKSKGFEVVRSMRAAPETRSLPNDEIALDEPYRDDVGKPTSVVAGRKRNLDLEDEGDAIGGGTRRLPEEQVTSTIPEREEDDIDDDLADEEEQNMLLDFHTSPVPPMLPEIDAGSSINMPSRAVSKASVHHAGDMNMNPPAVPRKSSRRQKSLDTSTGLSFGFSNTTHLSVIAPSPPSTPNELSEVAGTMSQRMPFGLDHSPSSTTHQRSTSFASSISALTYNSMENTAARRERAPSPLQPPASYFKEDRPLSRGSVLQHRASDNVVHPVNQTATGSTAELVDDPSRRTPSPAGRSPYLNF